MSSCVDRLGALTEGGKTLGVRSFHSGDPDVITVLHTVCLAPAAQPKQLGTSLADSNARRLVDYTVLLCTRVKYHSGTGGSYVEKPAETQTTLI
jgi:hypothetical protein